MAAMTVDTIVILASPKDLPWEFGKAPRELDGPFVGKTLPSILRAAKLDPKAWKIFEPDPMGHAGPEYETLWIRPKSAKGKKPAAKKGGKKPASKKTRPSSKANPRRKKNPHVDVTEHDIKEALKRPDSFGYSGDRPMFKTWSLGPVVNHRDATILAKANWAALEKELEAHPEWADQWETTGANHWAVGWVDHLSFQVLDENREPTEIFRFLKGWFDGLVDDPVASDSVYSEMQFDAYTERLDQDLDQLERSKLRDELPDDWRDQFYEKLKNLEWEYDQQDVPYHDDATLESIAADLDLLDEEYAENPEHDPVYLVMRDRASAVIRGGQIVALDYERDGTIYTRLYDQDADAVSPWVFHPSTGWTTETDHGREYDLIAAVTRSPDARSANPIGPGFGGWIGWALGGSLAGLTSIIFGVGMPGALLTGWTLGTLGAAIGGYMAAPQDRKRGTAIGAAAGNAIFPILGIGAALGGWIGAKEPDRQEVQDARLRRGMESNSTHRKIKNRVLR